MHRSFRILSILSAFLVSEGPSPSQGDETDRKAVSPLPTPGFTWDANAWEKGSGMDFWRVGRDLRTDKNRSPLRAPSRDGKPSEDTQPIFPNSRQSEK